MAKTNRRPTRKGQPQKAVALQEPKLELIGQRVEEGFYNRESMLYAVVEAMVETFEQRRGGP